MCCGPRGEGHSGSCGWWMSIPASRSSIYPSSLLCNLYGGGGGGVTGLCTSQVLGHAAIMFILSTQVK